MYRFFLIKFLIFLMISYNGCTNINRKKYYLKDLKQSETQELSIPVNIMGEGNLKSSIMAKYIVLKNKDIDYDYAFYLSNIYIQEASQEGVNHDIAFAQMCLETGYLRFGNQVKSVQNNFAGIGATDDGASGNSFPSPRIGIRAQIQHLKAYASYNEIMQPIVDPRFKYVKRGIAPTIYDLGGKWASDPNYGAKIERILKELYNLQINEYTLNK